MGLLASSMDASFTTRSPMGRRNASNSRPSSTAFRDDLPWRCRRRMRSPMREYLMPCTRAPGLLRGRHRRDCKISQGACLAIWIDVGDWCRDDGEWCVCLAEPDETGDGERAHSGPRSSLLVRPTRQSSNLPLDALEELERARRRISKAGWTFVGFRRQCRPQWEHTSAAAQR